MFGYFTGDAILPTTGAGMVERLKYNESRPDHVAAERGFASVPSGATAVLASVSTAAAPNQRFQLGFAGDRHLGVQGLVGVVRVGETPSVLFGVHRDEIATARHDPITPDTLT